VIVVGGSAAAIAAKTATTTIPIVFTGSLDPVKLGLVASLRRPGGNITGVTRLAHALAVKQLELLQELVPKTTVIAVLVNPDNPSTESDLRDLQDAARALKVRIHILRANGEREIDTGIAMLVQQQAGAMLVGNDVLFANRREKIVAAAAHNAIPAAYSFREFIEAGGLMSYGASATESYRQVGIYTGRILKGTKPTDLPVQQVTKVELVINLKTAKALGITFPLPLLGRADEVIE